ncbi:right-handed parallel beta-helix repeat-containing protein [Haloarcula onubensis]|uniref:Right-handed parallel beta-helix repeat-containing protein n=1 Tax=Haloarcula onubensis TaxID=2950539 RepID=A0ABU2FKF2_9EURY|nr:right-handed parallel beta-helix repeat-containing protein [Halomicroarcula sp. S3CR25-11]MDS0281217.1 right-handed parallel beta-helix repeat-containing protein [Halomicroarcula sp. S3CR25-11]
MSANSGLRSVGLSALLVLSVVAMTSPAAAVTASADSQSQQADATTITGCTVIDESGHYRLAVNVSTDGTCIEITASDVVFDGQGHTINDIDRNAGGNGIEVNVGATGRLSNVTIRDVRLTNWVWNDFGSNGIGLRMERVDDASITDVTVVGSDHGIRLRNVTGTTITDTAVSQVNNHGIYMDRNADNNTLSSNTITQAGRRGLLLQSSSNNTVEASTIAGSGNENVRLASGSNHNTFADNEIYRSSYPDGCVDVSTTASHLVFRNNSVFGCGGHGISFSQAGSHSLLVGNNVSANRNHGIRLNRLRNVTVRENTANHNGGHGINLQRSANHTVTDNYARENERFGINLYDVDGATLRENTVASNENGGLRFVSGSANNTVVDNTVLNYAREEVVSFPTGIRLRTADDNELRGTVVENAYVGIEINESADGNTLVDTRVTDAGTARWTLVTTASTGTTVESLDIGPSSADNTTLSFGAYNVSLAPNTSAPANPDAAAIGRYVTVESMGAGAFLDLSMQYESGDIAGVNESLLALWTYDGGWTEREESAVNTRAMTVQANVTVPATVGVFATDDGDSHAVALPSTPSSTATATETATDPATDASAGTAPATTGGNGPGFDAVAGLVALVACALWLRRQH